MKKSLLFAIGLSGLVMFNACKKEEDNDDDDTTPPPVTTSPSNPTPTPTDADGVCVAIKSFSVTSSPIGNITTDIGLAVAVFPNSGGTFQDAGAITCNTEALSKQTNNSYVYTPSVSSPTGIDFSSSNDWSVAGAGSITGFTYSHNNNIPKIGDLTASATVSLSTNLSLGINMASPTNLYGADSIYYGVYGPSGSALFATAGGTTTHTFTASQLSGIGTGSGYVQIAAVKFHNQLLSGQNIYFINEGVMTKSVTFE